MHHSPEVDKLISKFQLEKHPEGGFYKRNYASLKNVNTPCGERLLTTCIYFLICPGNVMLFIYNM
eukprot:Pgem_evm1s9915